ncbi:MAG: hypothetical protein HY074_07840, partial [Deltaproteobacteria bacterium]|nr:hypothetical protein [Deltaproteobacteria bacterium]
MLTFLDTHAMPVGPLGFGVFLGGLILSTSAELKVGGGKKSKRLAGAAGSDDAMPFLDQVRSFTWPFWVANIMEMLERLAYYGVRTVIPIYIASSQDPFGLHFTHIQKGEIF